MINFHKMLAGVPGLWSPWFEMTLFPAAPGVSLSIVPGFLCSFYDNKILKI